MGFLYILYVGGMEFPCGNAAAQRVLSNSKILHHLGFSPILLGQGRPDDSAELSEVDIGAGFPSFVVPRPISLNGWFHHTTSIRNIVRVISDFGAHNFFAVVAYNFPAPASLALLNFCRRHRIHYISDVTEWYAKGRTVSSLVKDLDTELRMEYAIPRGKNVICISSLLSAKYQGFGCKTLILPSLVDYRDNKWAKPGIARKGPVRLAFAGTVGRSGTKERLDWVIEALCDLSGEGIQNFKLDLVGLDRRQFIQAYGSETSKAIDSLGDRLRFWGRQSHEKAIELLTCADFSLIVRERNRVTTAGFPTKLAESWACHTPVIATPTSDIANYMIDNCTGHLIHGFDKESIRDTLAKAITAGRGAIEDMRAFISEKTPLDYRHFIKGTDFFLNHLISY